MCLSVKVNDPSRVISKGEAYGLEWAVTHNGMAYRCGYVRIPAGHPWHGKSYHDIPAKAHGGLTFSAPDVPCTVPGPDNAWWIGFDCAHGFDLADPALPCTHPAPPCFPLCGREIRTQEYVEQQCMELCAQAAGAAASAPSSSTF